MFSYKFFAHAYFKYLEIIRLNLKGLHCLYINVFRHLKISFFRS